MNRRFFEILLLAVTLCSHSHAQWAAPQDFNVRELPRYQKPSEGLRYLKSGPVPYYSERNEGFQFQNVREDDGFCQNLVIFIKSDYAQRNFDQIALYRDSGDRRKLAQSYDIRDEYEITIGHPLTQYYLGRDLVESGEREKIIRGVSYIEAAAMKNYVPAQVLLGKLLAESARVKLELTRLAKEAQDGISRKDLGDKPTEEDETGEHWDTYLPAENPIPSNLDEAYLLLRTSIGKVDPDIETDHYILALQRVLGESKVDELEARIRQLPVRTFCNFETRIGFFFMP